jgi:hypothetical protein
VILWGAIGAFWLLVVLSAAWGYAKSAPAGDRLDAFVRRALELMVLLGFLFAAIIIVHFLFPRELCFGYERCADLREIEMEH